MSGRSAAAQRALYTALRDADPPVAGGRVFDHDPGDAAPYPHVVIGGGQAIPDDTSEGDDGVSEFFDLHVWDRPAADGGHRGFLRAKAEADGIHTVLHGAALAIDGRNSAFAFVRNARTLEEPDGLTRRVVVTVEIIHRS